MEINMPIIGKDVIESLTLGMYEDCRFIYREYIQNSADQIDKAIEQGLLTQETESIHITIDSNKRYVEIYDNATGIPEADFISILRDIAKSRKERGKDKGFRGIGRLGGLGYCDKLIFETSFKGEHTKSKMIWDASLLKSIINDRLNKENASDVIEAVTKIETSDEVTDEHYFRVILEGVTNMDLLDVSAISSYLKMVAPLRYQSSFIFRTKIYDYVRSLNVKIDEYKIFLNCDLLYKGCTTSIYTGSNGSLKKIDEIFELEFFNQFDKHNHLLYWGWYGISTFEKQIDSNNLARGIRLRKNNIQIGSDYTLVKLHREQRGNYYFFGEVHATHPDLIPNSRRDYFSENTACHLFEKQLKEMFHTKLYKLYYEASKIRSANKDIQNLYEFSNTLNEKEQSGFTNNDDKNKLYQEYEEKKKKADDARKKLENIKTKAANENIENPVTKIFDRIVKDNHIEEPTIIKEPNNRTVYMTDRYTWLPKHERKLLSKVFSVITNFLSKDLAKNLIDKIDEELRKS